MKGVLSTLSECTTVPYCILGLNGALQLSQHAICSGYSNDQVSLHR